MFTEALRKELETLFIEKKYEEVIKISEKKLDQNEIPASLSNLIGVCKMLKKERSLEDVSSALTYFEGAYIKGKKTIHGLNGLTHLISISLQFLKENRQLEKFLIKAIGLPKNMVPANIQTVKSSELEAQSGVSIADFMVNNLQGVTVNEVGGNPFQLELNFRGYNATPIAGNPQGLSVYIDGIRTNQAFSNVGFCLSSSPVPMT